MNSTMNKGNYELDNVYNNYGYSNQEVQIRTASLKEFEIQEIS